MINYSYWRIFRFVGSFSHLEKGRILYGEVKNKTVLYSQILNTQNCIPFKISALGLFLKYCQISQYSQKIYFCCHQGCRPNPYRALSIFGIRKIPTHWKKKHWLRDLLVQVAYCETLKNLHTVCKK